MIRFSEIENNLLKRMSKFEGVGQVGDKVWVVNCSDCRMMYMKVMKEHMIGLDYTFLILLLKKENISS